MFLWQKYKNYSLSKKGIKANFLLDSSNIATDAERWLKDIFLQKRYDYESQNMFEINPYFMKQFLQNEMLRDDGCIRLVFPRGMYDEKERKESEQLTGNFLLQMHDSILNGGVPNLNNNLCLVLLNDNPLIQIALNDNAFDARMEKQIKIGIKVVTYGGADITTFIDYVNYLVYINRIYGTFRDFWDNVVKLTRSNKEPYRSLNLAETSLPNKYLLLLCIALGLDHKVFDRLVKLREKDFDKKICNFKFPIIGNNEENELYKFLMDAHWRICDARGQVNSDEKIIPRRMLLNANIDLIKKNLKPIIELYGNDEVTYTQSKVGREKLNQYYEPLENGNRKFSQ